MSLANQVIRVEDEFDIHATSLLANEQTRVLKHGETFGVFDRYGDIQSVGLGKQGIFHEGTRHLSRFVMRVGHRRPLLLSSGVTDDNVLLTADLTNADLPVDGEVVPQESVHLLRSKFLWEGACYEQVRLRNYATEPVQLALTFEFDADFRDIFEVRGTPRPQRGIMLGPVVTDSTVTLAYEGLDGLRRSTHISCDQTPEHITPSSVRFRVHMAPQEEWTVQLTARCMTADELPAITTYAQSLGRAEEHWRSCQSAVAQIQTADEQFNSWLRRAYADLHMLTTETSTGPYVYAGVPWFSTPFGRDGILTALQTLTVHPGLAAGVLRFLATTQAREDDPRQDAEPGKILHEARGGEMANLGEIPFGRYYGSVDATPLFVMLAGAYYRRTADRELLSELWPHVERALGWIDEYGDQDGDGFVEYATRSEHGLLHQGWKDSRNAVFHADGASAAPPIALCEVQGYVYAAKRAAHYLAMALGHAERAQDLEYEAARLRRRFDEAFWSPELGTYVLALDADKAQCAVRTSNAAHALYTGIALPERAETLTGALLGADSFSGWGIRTVADGEARYNPMSYHNGSVWPHDNALAAHGLARYGMQSSALTLLSAMFDASLNFDLRRLPELFCGFARRANEGPTVYPVACSPQAWSAGAVFMLLDACLGLRIDTPRSQVRLTRPVLPPYLDEVHLTNLRVGAGAVDLVLHRHAHDVGVTVARREGEIEVVTIK